MNHVDPLVKLFQQEEIIATQLDKDKDQHYDAAMIQSILIFALTYVLISGRRLNLIKIGQEAISIFSNFEHPLFFLAFFSWGTATFAVSLNNFFIG